MFTVCQVILKSALVTKGNFSLSYTLMRFVVLFDQKLVLLQKRTLEWAFRS